MKKFFVVLMFVFVSVLIAQEQKQGEKETKIDGILRVFMHQPGDYSVMVLENEEYKVYRIWSWSAGGGKLWLVSVDFFSDCVSAWSGIKVEQKLKKLPKNEKKMYLLAKGYPKEHKIVVTIFISSEKDVEGGDWKVYERWNAGRNGRTTVVR